MNRLYWVGTRQSDIEDSGNLFDGSITIFGDNCDGNISFCTDKVRVNHNISHKESDLFFIKTLESLCKKDDRVRFVFYNPILAYEYGDIVKQHTLCLNPYNLLDTLSNKYRSRIVLKNVIDTVPYVKLKGTECSYDNIRNYFIGYDEFVIQKPISSGGEGTFHIYEASDINFIIPDEEYLISPYINDSLSLNAHVMISENNILQLPLSIQIITEIENKMLYSGSDFICYKSLPDNLIHDIEYAVDKLGCFVQQKGYRGILGIDLIIKDDHIYFTEFNTRFQASSHLINKSLYSLYKVSLQEMNIHAFESANVMEVGPIDVNYSSYIYTNDNISKERLIRVAKSEEILSIQTDGFYVDKDVYPRDKNVYLNRCIFSRNICSIKNKVVLHPNIYVEDMKHYISANNSHYKEYLKIALLNHGVGLSESAMQLAKSYGKIKSAVFDAIDIIIFDYIHVNVPFSCKFNTISPFTIEAVNNKFIVSCDGKKVSDINIYFAEEQLLDMHTKSGVSYDSIINLATDRIRINPAPVCCFKQNNLQCKFCNLPTANESYDITDIKEVIDYCLKNVKFRHFLIGGGTYTVDNKSWDMICEIASYIKKKCDKDIYLMSIPPSEKYTLARLKNSGITEVAFNLEVFDRVLAEYIMPGKGKISENQYISALKNAVCLWGRTGKVRSLLIYGFDSDDTFLKGIEYLCDLGVEPIISIFRPLNGTEFSELNPPPTCDIINIYNKCQNIVSKYSMILGPDCPMCQNNTLSYTNL